MVEEIRHPLVASWLGELRDAETPPPAFRRLLRRLSTALFLHATRDYPVQSCRRRTPLTEIDSCSASAPPALVPVLRAGLGMVEGVLELAPEASVHHLGLFRDHATLEPVSYYTPDVSNAAGRWAFVLDPMLATGGSAAAAIQAVRAWNVAQIKLLCVLAAPEGLQRVQSEHPDVEVVTCCIDERLNEVGYIVPGLGDAGDRQFGT